MTDYTQEQFFGFCIYLPGIKQQKKPAYHIQLFVVDRGFCTPLCPYLRPVPERDRDFLILPDRDELDHAAPKACVKLIYKAFLLLQLREEGS